MKLRVRGHEAEAKLPEWADLLAFEAAKEKSDFAAMRGLWRAVHVSGGERLPAAVEISFAATILRIAGSGADVSLVAEDDYPEAVAEAAVRLEDRGPLYCFHVLGVFLLVREPRNPEIEAFWKGRDKSILRAALALARGVTIFGLADGSPVTAPMDTILERVPAAVAGIAEAITQMAGLTLEVEVGEA